MDAITKEGEEVSGKCDRVRAMLEVDPQLS